MWKLHDLARGIPGAGLDSDGPARDSAAALPRSVLVGREQGHGSGLTMHRREVRQRRHPSERTFGGSPEAVKFTTGAFVLLFLEVVSTEVASPGCGTQGHEAGARANRRGVVEVEHGEPFLFLVQLVGGDTVLDDLVLRFRL